MSLSGVGIGFRRDIAEVLLHREKGFGPRFLEVAPENWMNVGGHWGKLFRQATEKYPLTCHGLSLSLGSPEELDWGFLKSLKKFLSDFPVQIYSEHLSYAKCDNAHLYDLLPIPFRWDAVKHVANRIRQVQDFLERPLLIENVSYYTPIAPEMDEATFVSAVLEESGCFLLLDVNNVYVNSFNHRYDAKEFLKKLPLDRVRAIHMAGHEKKGEDLIIDTHGAPIIDPVYELFEWAIALFQPVPVLLERDFHFSDIEGLFQEVDKLQKIVDSVWGTEGIQELQHVA